MSAQQGRRGNAARAGTVPAASERPSEPPREPRNTLRLALRLIGINEFLWLADAGDGPGRP
jgi:hypothetical protein